MAGFARSLRFVVGVSMVAGGSTLAAPLAMRLAATWCGTTAEQPAWAAGAGPGMERHPDHAGGQPLAEIRMQGPQTLAEGVFVAPPPDQPPVAGGGIAALGHLPAAGGGMAAIAAAAPMVPLRPEYQPPPPPDPLPPQPTEFAQPGPALGHAYRSTLDVPPPQLLDAQSPPPLAVAATVQEASRATSARPGVKTAFVPATYRVRDGDDLAGIATRFYGQPAAAAAVWAANRDTIPDPSLLMIGAELRLPPPWAVGLGDAPMAAGPAIEPPADGSPPNVHAAAPVGPAAVHPWLAVSTEAARSTSAPPSTSAATIQPASSTAIMNSRERSPRVVRVGPGESLATIAQRFYGDAGMAARIWEANRGRLRSPELVVPGMELTLP